MHKGLFTDQDNVDLAELIKAKQGTAQHTDQPEAVPVLSDEEFAKIQEEQRLAELNKITHVSQLQTLQRRPDTRKAYFTTGKAKYKMDLDHSGLAPSGVTMLSYKSFEVNYLKQLNSVIYNEKDELDPDKLIRLIQMVSHLKDPKDLIQIKSGKFSRTLPLIVKCLNEFFRKNHSVIYGMEQMFNGIGKTDVPDSDYPPT